METDQSVSVRRRRRRRGGGMRGRRGGGKVIYIQELKLV
jgi:hypothetical protein